MEKVVVFTPSLNIGGIERILLTYAKGLANKGNNVTYLTLDNQGDFELEDCENLSYESLGIDRLRKSLFAMVRFLKRTKPNVILVANNATAIVYLAKVLSGSSVKIISSQHNYFDNYKRISLKQSFVPRFIFPRCYRVIAVSEGIKDMLINVFNMKAEKIVTICNPIDIERIVFLARNVIPDLPKEYFLFVGRLDTVKNVPLLLDSFKEFAYDKPNLKLLIIGGGPEELNILKYLKEIDLLDKVILLGIKSNPFPYIESAKAVVLSSITEAFPTILLESLILGKTIVSTPTKGGKDILKNGTYGYISSSLYGKEDLCVQLNNAYYAPFDSEILKEYCQSNYSLSRKVNEIESLWTTSI